MPQTSLPNNHSACVAMTKYKQHLPRGASRQQRAEHFLKRAKEVHGDLYDYSLVLATFSRQQSNVTIICSKHGKFEQLATNHLAGKGCRKCAKEHINAIRYKAQYELAQKNVKVCSSCNLVQPFENFPSEPNGRKIGKVSAWCKNVIV